MYLPKLTSAELTMDDVEHMKIAMRATKEKKRAEELASAAATAAAASTSSRPGPSSSATASSSRKPVTRSVIDFCPAVGRPVDSKRKPPLTDNQADRLAIRTLTAVAAGRLHDLPGPSTAVTPPSPVTPMGDPAPRLVRAPSPYQPDFSFSPNNEN